MTTVNYAAIEGVLQKRFAPNVRSTINREVPLLQLLEVQDADGPNIQRAIETGTASAGSGASIGDGTDVSTFNADTKLTQTLTYGTYHDAFEVSGKAMAGARAAGNPEQLANIFAHELNRSSLRLAKAIAEECYTGTGATDRIAGLTATVLPATGTYAGIDKGTYPGWAGNEIANGGTPRALTVALMRKAMRLAKKMSGFRPDIIVCGPSTHEQYGLLLGEQRRYLDTVRGPGGAMIRLDGGYNVLEFDGRPVVEDINCAEGQMLFLNRSLVRMRQLPQPTGTPLNQGVQPLTGQVPEAQAQAATGLQVRIQALGPAGDKFRFALYVYPQLDCEMPNSTAWLKDLSYTA